MQEVPLFPLWVYIFLAIWSVVGPIAGVVVGHLLSASKEHKRWIADNEKDEYRKLLIALNRLNMAYGTGYNLDANEFRGSLAELAVATNTSLFISDFLKESKVIDDVRRAGKEFTQGGDFGTYQDKYWKTVNLIVDAAKKIKA